ncbi:MAG: hypothetical protein QJR09_07640 [Micrococcus sp.]|nr:hypothetical protein [Micrococcus sp.]
MTHAAGRVAGSVRPGASAEGPEQGRHRTTPRLQRALAMGVLTGAGTLIPFWRIPRRPLMTVGGIAGAVVATAGVELVRDQAEREAAVQGGPPPEVRVVRRLGAPVLTGVAAGVVTAGVLWLSSVTDELSEKAVARLGARRPRVTLAVIAGVSTAVLEYADSGPGQEPDGEPRAAGRGVESTAKH